MFSHAACVLPARWTSSSPQARFGDGPEAVLGDVIGKHARQKQRYVTEASVDAGTFTRVDDVQQSGETHRVKFREPLASEASPRLDVHRPARDMRVRREQLSEEQAMDGHVEPRSKQMCAEHRESPTRTYPLVHEPRTRQVGTRLLDTDGEHAERRCA
jgi:hypothetical protein